MEGIYILDELQSNVIYKSKKMQWLRDLITQTTLFCISYLKKN